MTRKRYPRNSVWSNRQHRLEKKTCKKADENAAEEPSMENTLNQNSLEDVKSRRRRRQTPMIRTMMKHTRERSVSELPETSAPRV